MLSPWVERRRAPESQRRRPPASAEGPHPDVQGGGGPKGHGGAVAGDGEGLDEYPPSLDRLLDLKVDLVLPTVVTVGEDGLGDGRNRRQQDDGHDLYPPRAGLPPALQRHGPVAQVTLPVCSALAALAEPAVRPEGTPPAAPVLRPCPLRSPYCPSACGGDVFPARLGHKAQWARAGLLLPGCGGAGASLLTSRVTVARRSAALPACT